jgi:hypothetical protein
MTVLAYEAHKDRARKRQREQAKEGQDIGAIPWVADPARRLAASRDFRLYCETYHRETFTLGWSDDHLKVIRQIEDSVIRGGLFATAMPRGSGKTSLAEVACEFAMVNGYHQFVCLLGSDEPAAEGMLDSIKTELEVNDDLAEDYPEVCVAIEALEGIPNRCKSQHYNNERTRIEWTVKSIVLPSVKPVGWFEKEDHRAFVRDDGYSLASGSIVKVAGITGGIRGMKRKTAEGKTIRPTLVVPDDPQTDASARSPSQCETRERILAGAILGLAGPGKRISGIMPCTVIRSGDMADNILDREKHPEWHGTRTKLVYKFPKNEKLWDEYKQIRSEAMKSERGHEEANRFYLEHRSEMDEGAVVAWEDRKEPHEISAIQHAMNLRFDRGDRAFFAEFQNEPLPEDEVREDDLTVDQILAKLNRQPRSAVPAACNRLTAFVDVQGSALYYVVAAWEDDFTGYVVDYGTFPDQKRAYFTLRDLKVTLKMATKAPDLEGQIYGGLKTLTDALIEKDWQRDDGTTINLDRCMIDANWGASTEVVYQFCKQSAHSGILLPSHGKYVGASSLPMGEYYKKVGEKAGFNWRIKPSPHRGLRYVLYDTNFWKSFIHTRLSVPMGSRSCLSLFGTKPDQHRLFADHLCAEFRIRTEGRGRVCEEWKIKPERPDNHWFDGLVGCAVAASMGGVSLPETTDAGPRKPRERIKLSDIQRQKRA